MVDVGCVDDDLSDDEKVRGRLLKMSLFSFPSGGHFLSSSM